RVVHQILAAPAGALDDLPEPPARFGEIAFAGERPPGEAAADAGEQRSGHRPLAQALECQRTAADADQPSRHRKLFARAVPPPAAPDADRCAVAREVFTSGCRVHAPE